MINAPERQVLRDRLRETVDRSRRSRLMRVLSHPRRSARLRWLRATGQTWEAVAQTFFGRPMTVILPEQVSAGIWQDGFTQPEVCLFLLHTLPHSGGFIDIGAHYGFFTLLAAQLTGEQGRVLALEPTPATYQILQRNVAIFPNVETRMLAAFSEAKQIVMHDHGTVFSAFNALSGIRLPGGRGPTSWAEVIVQARRVDDLLDDLGWSQVDVIKIDAESSEWQVLQGLEKTLRQFRPSLILEVGDYNNAGSAPSRQVIDWIVSLGYAALEAGDRGIAPHHVCEHYGYANLLFVADRHP